MQLITAFNFIISLPLAIAIRCFTCASAEYEPLFERFVAFRHSLSSENFGDLCDSAEMMQAMASLQDCPSTCISIMEPQYFGGVQSLHTPFTYIRGCASTIFGDVPNRAPEIDFLHTEPICLPLRLSQIWPSIQADEHIQVCSCTSDGCNTDVAFINGSSKFIDFNFFNLIFLLIILQLII